MKTLPGALLSGGHETHHELQVPMKAIDKWEADNGWKGQHHLIHLPLHRLTPKGLKLVAKLTKRITSAGGYIQFGIWGTPEHLASVPTYIRDHRDRPIYPKHPPSDYQAWVDGYIQVVISLMASVGPLETKRMYFNLWLEPHRYWWRSSNRRFFKLYHLTQQAIKDLPGKFGGVQVCDLINATIADQVYTRMPAMEWIENWFRLANKYDWRIDFVDVFQYNGDAKRVVGKILDVEDLMLKYDIKAELIFNCLSSGIGHGDNYERQVEYTRRLHRLISDHTGVDRMGFDFLEESWPGKHNGLLTWETLEETPRYEYAKEVNDG